MEKTKKQKVYMYSVSCNLSAAPAPADSDRHQTGPNLLGPAIVRDWSLPVHIDSLMVSAGDVESQTPAFDKPQFGGSKFDPKMLHVFYSE